MILEESFSLKSTVCAQLALRSFSTQNLNTIFEREYMSKIFTLYIGFRHNPSENNRRNPKPTNRQKSSQLFP